MNDYAPSEQLLEFLRHWEGLPGGVPALEAYLDSAGVPTIGYGHTAGVQMGDTCTEDQAEEWLYEETAWFLGRVLGFITVSISEDEAAGCAALAYNIGIGAPKVKDGFSTSQVLANINGGRSDLAEAAFSNWRFVTVNGRKVENRGLVRRRLAERAIYARGDYRQWP